MTSTRLIVIFLLAIFFEVSSVLKVKGQTSYPGNSVESHVVIGSHAIGGPGGALQDKLYGFDFSYQTDISHLSDKWVSLSNAKSAGVGLVYRDLQFLKGHNDTSANAFGKAFGLVGQMDFNLLEKGSTSVSLRPGVGISYLTKTYFTDKRNRFIGSHINEVLKADLLLKVSLNTKVDLIAGAGFLHYSNGGYNIPNSGINMLSLSTGLRFKREAIDKQERQTQYVQLRKNTFELNFGIGRRGVYESHDGLLKSGIYAGYNYYINDILSLRSGFDAVYYYTPFNPAPGRDIQTFQYYGTSYDKWRTGVSLGAEASIWRLALNAQAGKYLHYNSYYKDIAWFWTTGLTYHLTPHIGLQAKTYFHRSQADFINYGLVFKI